MLPHDKMTEYQKEYDDLKDKVCDISLMQDKKYYRNISKRFKFLEELLSTYNKIIDLEKNIEYNEELIRREKDDDLIDMAKEDNQDLAVKLQEAIEVLKDLLAPKDPNDDKDAIVEIRAGTGGEEAALFVSDLYRMYSHYADKNKWKMTLLSSNPTGIGGYKEIIFSLSGVGVFGTMKFESGVHRVQRVPETEANGRIHTSAISVAVLPEADEVDIDIQDKDLRIDVYRSSGHGGQSVNTTDSAVRITHIPTGLVVTCQDEKSQYKNKDKAMKVLRSRILDMEVAKQHAEISSQRKLLVGSGDRSAKIRTYNFPQSRVTDHRINLTLYKLDQILVGEIDEFLDSLKLAYKNDLINN